MRSIEKTFHIVQVLLSSIEQQILTPMSEGVGADTLQKRINRHKDTVGRLKIALRKHKDSERRKSELTRDNKKRNG